MKICHGHFVTNFFRAQELLGNTSAQAQIVVELEHAAANLQAMAAAAAK